MKSDVPEIRGFTGVDQTENPAAFVQFLDTVSAAEIVKRYKQRTFALLDAREGDVVLDLGCGLGDDAHALARRVGPSGRVIGIDASQAMIAAARLRQSEPLPVEFRLGDAYHLEFVDGCFDRCRADRVFHHLADPDRALQELVRVARAGARVVVSEPDFGTMVVDAPDQLLTRRILTMRCDTISSPWFARRLPRLFRGLGLTDITVVPEVLVFTEYALANRMIGLATAVDAARGAGLVSEDEGTAWLQGLVEADRRGDFFATGTMFLVGARRR